MDIAITGNYNRDSIDSNKFTVHKVLRPSYKLYVGSECNDGRPITESWKYKQAVKLGVPIVRKKPEIAKEEKKCISKEMFVDKYTPKNVSDIIGHKEQIKQITSWLQSWSEGYPTERGILVTGPPGIGKTTTVHLIAESLGYKVTEYNASDTRSVSVLRGMIALGIKRLVNEIIVMDEIDGLSERGGIGEIASIIKKTATPIICITNDKPPKLRPIINACLDIKFNRPVKSTIANALLKIVKSENIEITKASLESLCEENGNDIRSILNNLEFYGQSIQDSLNNKDSTLRLDAFSATQRLIGNKKLSFDDAANLVFVDYNMIPLMVEEAYIGSSKGSLEDVVKASEFISTGDIIDRQLHKTQNWGLLPHYVQSSVSAAKTVSGPAPFQIFPQWLGKNSKRLKHRRYMDNLSSKFSCSNDVMRMDYAEPVENILLNGLETKESISTSIHKMDELNLTRDDVMDELQEVLFEKTEIPTKVKTAFTREYNKIHTNKKSSKSIKKLVADDKMDLDDDNDDEIEDNENEIDNLENNLYEMEL
jgi:replication factor C subunit 1